MKRALKILLVLVLIALGAWALWSYGCPFCQAQTTPGKPSLPFSPAVKVNRMIYVSGQIGASPESGVLAEAIRGQTRQALENIKAIVEAAGSCLKHVVKTTVFLQDIGEWPAMNAIYAEYFPEEAPARSAVQAAGLPMGARMEIEVVAVACDCKEGECDDSPRSEAERGCGCQR